MEDQANSRDLEALGDDRKTDTTYVWNRSKEDLISEASLGVENEPSGHTHVRVRSDVDIQYSMDEFEDAERVDTNMSFSHIPRRVFNRRRTRELNMTQEEAGCFKYLPVTACAKYLVNDIIQRAELMISEQSDEKIDPPLEDQYNLNVWPNSGDFTAEKGVDAIETYLIYSCYFQEDWSYKIDLLESKSDSTMDYYLYEVKFSLPTQVYPVAQATTSLYFNIEVCRSLPPACPIRVTFQLEGLSFKFKPFQYVLNDDMLLRTIQAKLNLFKRVKF